MRGPWRYLAMYVGFYSQRSLNSFDNLFLKNFLKCGPVLKSLLNLLQYCFCFFIFWCFGCEACESHLPDQGSNLHPLHWKAKSELKLLPFLKRAEGSGHKGPQPFQVTFGCCWAALAKIAPTLQFSLGSPTHSPLPPALISFACSALGGFCSLYLLLQ